MKIVTFVIQGNYETQPLPVPEFEPPPNSLRNEIDGNAIKVWLPGSNPPEVITHNEDE